ncbi:DUF5956 family protein [Streptomyces sp. 7N604]|uniref:DUF5956 family protein n=1 Tax=Streptomyces sp. 7N604 TaxID=3457415 RepID=UPI003FD60ABF
MDWGWNEEPHPLAKGHPDNADLEVNQLPEIIALHEQGWYSRLGPRWQFLPCIWPPQHRTWVPNRSTHYAWQKCIDYSIDPQGTPLPRQRIRWTPALLGAWEEEANAELEDIGVPVPRPIGRIWFLRPFAGFAAVEEMVRHLDRITESRGVERLSAEFVLLVAEELHRLAG